MFADKKTNIKHNLSSQCLFYDTNKQFVQEDQCDLIINVVFLVNFWTFKSTNFEVNRQNRL